MAPKETRSVFPPFLGILVERNASTFAGGKFNPLLDSTKTTGQDFHTYYEELTERR